MVKGIRVLGSLAFVLGLFALVFVAIPWSVTVVNDPKVGGPLPWWFKTAVYLLLGGMTGTAREVSGELRSVYGLKVVRVPPNRPIQRIDLGTRIFSAADAKWSAVVARIRELRLERRPVLVGTTLYLPCESYV